MARRRNDRDGSGIVGKFVTWVVIIVIIVWAARNPADAATVVRYIATAIGNLASQYGKHHH
jgi:hypothetical protein